MANYSTIPDNLPVPDDDGLAQHLPGLTMPSITLATSDKSTVKLDNLGGRRSIIYLYPLTGRPDSELPEGWDAIPGARGCTSEACDFRDHLADPEHAGVERVFGLSSQSPEYQAEATERLHLPFAMISDPTFALADTVQLPTFSAPGHDRLYRRLTLIVNKGVIEHMFYPVFPPNTHAQQVLDWVASHPVAN